MSAYQLICISSLSITGCIPEQTKAHHIIRFLLETITILWKYKNTWPCLITILRLLYHAWINKKYIHYGLLCYHKRVSKCLPLAIDKRNIKYILTLPQWKTLMSSFEYKLVKEVFWADQRDLGRSTMPTNKPHNVNKPFISFDV